MSLSGPPFHTERHGDNVRVWLHEKGKVDWCTEIPLSICRDYKLLEFLVVS